MTLDELNVGDKCIATKIIAKNPLKRKIMDMGIIRGSEIYVNKFAPLKDPIEIIVRGYKLSIRKEEAKFIEVQI